MGVFKTGTYSGGKQFKLHTNCTIVLHAIGVHWSQQHSTNKFTMWVLPVREFCWQWCVDFFHRGGLRAYFSTKIAEHVDLSLLRLHVPGTDLVRVPRLSLTFLEKSASMLYRLHVVNSTKLSASLWPKNISTVIYLRTLLLRPEDISTVIYLRTLILRSKDICTWPKETNT